LLYLQSKSATDEAAIEAFKESQNRIKSMALLHEKLYRSSNMAKIDFAEYIKNLVSYLHQSYGASSRKIELKINIDNVLLGIDTAIPCGLIISELVSNSLKHAFPEGASGEIRVELHSVGDNGFKMIISDNGIGLKKDSDSRAGSTLGLQLVNALVKQIDGCLKLDSSHGTTFEIDFRQLKYKERD
jgi:two-component sensor histidine kinase